jgi:hypothetical protein
MQMAALPTPEKHPPIPAFVEQTAPAVVPDKPVASVPEFASNALKEEGVAWRRFTLTAPNTMRLQDLDAPGPWRRLSDKLRPGDTVTVIRADQSWRAEFQCLFSAPGVGAPVMYRLSHHDLPPVHTDSADLPAGHRVEYAGIADLWCV